MEWVFRARKCKGVLKKSATHGSWIFCMNPSSPCPSPKLGKCISYHAKSPKKKTSRNSRNGDLIVTDSDCSVARMQKVSRCFFQRWNVASAAPAWARLKPSGHPPIIDYFHLFSWCKTIAKQEGKVVDKVGNALCCVIVQLWYCMPWLSHKFLQFQHFIYAHI